MRANILHLRDTYEIGGPGKTILETISNIDHEKYKLHVGVFLKRNEKNDSPFCKEVIKRGGNIYILRAFNKYDPLILIKISNLVRTLKIDIIHSHEILSDILGCLVAKYHKIPVVTTIHGWIINTFMDRIKFNCDKSIIKKFDKIIVVSEQMLKQVMSYGISTNKVSLLYNSIVVDKYNNVTEKGYLDNLIDKKLQKPIIGTVGRLSLEKGQNDLIEAASIVIKKGYNATFIIIGDGPERDNLLQKINKLNIQSYVYLTGYLKNMQNVFKDLDLMVLPSYTEGLPNVVLEALMMRVPVIATRVGGTPEVVRDHKTGILIDPGSPEQISSKIIEYMKNPEKYNEMASVGRLMVIKEFNFIKRTQKLEKVYSELMCKTAVAE